MRKDLTNVLTIATILALGAASWALTHGRTPYYALDLIGAILLWCFLVLMVAALAPTLAKALRQE